MIYDFGCNDVEQIWADAIAKQIIEEIDREIIKELLDLAKKEKPKRSKIDIF